ELEVTVEVAGRAVVVAVTEQVAVLQGGAPEEAAAGRGPVVVDGPVGRGLAEVLRAGGRVGERDGDEQRERKQEDGGSHGVRGLQAPESGRARRTRGKEARCGFFPCDSRSKGAENAPKKRVRRGGFEPPEGSLGSCCANRYANAATGRCIPFSPLNPAPRLRLLPGGYGSPAEPTRLNCSR